MRAPERSEMSGVRCVVRATACDGPPQQLILPGQLQLSSCQHSTDNGFSRSAFCKLIPRRPAPVRAGLCCPSRCPACRSPHCSATEAQCSATQVCYSSPPLKPSTLLLKPARADRAPAACLEPSLSSYLPCLPRTFLPPVRCVSRYVNLWTIVSYRITIVHISIIP